MQTCTLMHEYTLHMWKHVCAHTQACICTYTQHILTDGHSCIHTNMLMHTRHTLMHAHTHAHTCAHTLNQIRSVMAILFPSLQNRQHDQEHFPFAKSYLQTLSTHVCPHPASPTVTEDKLCPPHEMNLQEAGPDPLPMPTSGGRTGRLLPPPSPRICIEESRVWIHVPSGCRGGPVHLPGQPCYG